MAQPPSPPPIILESQCATNLRPLARLLAEIAYKQAKRNMVESGQAKTSTKRAA